MRPLMKLLTRCVQGFLAGALSVLIFHQSVIALMHGAGQLPSGAWDMRPVPPFAVPRVLDLAFWGGLWAALFAAALPRLPRAPFWLLGLGLGVLAAATGWFVVAPLKGLPVAGGWAASRMLRSLAINGAWGIGVGLLLPLLAPRLLRRPARV